MSSLEIKRAHGKIFCPLTNDWNIETPEEKVRQEYIKILVEDYGYSLEQMAQELKVNNSQRGQGKARADIVIWKTKEDKNASKAAFMGMVLPEGVLNTSNLQKIREYFEGKAKIILICSIPQDVYCFMRSKKLREVAMSYFTGSAGQQRVGTDFLEALTLPKLPIRSADPTLLTQEKIVMDVFSMRNYTLCGNPP